MTVIARKEHGEPVNINLKRSVHKLYITAHEFTYAVGYYHMQSERDEYVEIVWNKFRREMKCINDYESVMQIL